MGELIVGEVEGEAEIFIGFADGILELFWHVVGDVVAIEFDHDLLLFLILLSFLISLLHLHLLLLHQVLFSLYGPFLGDHLLRRTVDRISKSEFVDYVGLFLNC